MARGSTHVEQQTGEDAVSHEQEEGGSIDANSEDEGNNRDADNSSEEESRGVKDEGEEGKSGWADTMAKILGKKTASGTILVKSKELDKAKETWRKEELEKKKQIDKKRLWEMMCRDKPDIVKDHKTERALQRIATRGVVQLFNSVRKHKKTTDDHLREVGGSERKKSKILSSFSKRDFISVLRQTEDGNGASRKTQEHSVPDSEEKPAWNVLREDFMMEASMKDWDRTSDRDGSDTQT
uniref:RRP15-like protein n=1 Tax=Iconisemion striatum TaxID=60296 RepID=A0A1A7XLR3_9TELE